jgi:hypothetical protein
MQFHTRPLLAALTLTSIALSPLTVSATNAAAATAGPSPQAKTDPARRISLASHRAVYELTLTKSVGTKSPTAAHGRIAFDFTASSCDGYVQNFRQLTELQPAEGPTRVSDMRSATYEDANGRSFDFKMQTTIDNGSPELIDGRALKLSMGRVSVSLTKPKRDKFELDSGVVFPTEHLKRILAAAEAGESSLEVKVYDGSEEGDKVYETTTFIGRPIADPAVEKAAHIPELDNIRRWPVSISYFESGKKDDAPSYVLSFDLYENGISRALKLDYGDFVLSGEMSSLELLNEPACPN